MRVASKTTLFLLADWEIYYFRVLFRIQEKEWPLSFPRLTLCVLGQRSLEKFFERAIDTLATCGAAVLALWVFWVCSGAPFSNAFICFTSGFYLWLRRYISYDS